MPHSLPRTTLVFLAGSIGLMMLPGEMQGTCRAAVGDLVRPGCQLWQSAHRSLATAWREWNAPRAETEAELLRLRKELAAARRDLRALEIQSARWQEDAAAHGPPLFASSRDESPERLARPVLIEAAVLGSAHAGLWRKGRWLAEGKAAGVLEEAPVLAGPQPLLDLGRDFGLSAEDALLIGRSVIGKVVHVGRWTSTFLLVTDSGYRGRAQLVRETADGYVFGAKGVLTGRGDGMCALEGIPAEEAVAVGDSVYTAERDGVLPTPLYYGRVTQATLKDREGDWSILVQPAEVPTDLTQVQVLRSALNPRRVLAN